MHLFSEAGWGAAAVGSWLASDGLTGRIAGCFFEKIDPTAQLVCFPAFNRKSVILRYTYTSCEHCKRRN